MVKFTLKASALLFSFAALVSTVTIAQIPEPTELTVEQVVELKKIFLECDQLASITVLDPDIAGFCSGVYQVLLSGVFDGSYELLLQWWRSARYNCVQFSRCDTQ